MQIKKLEARANFSLVERLKARKNLNLTKECDCMKKKIIAAICILLAIVLLIPIPMRMKDGGTVKYQAVLYSISDVHRLAPSEESGYEDGIIVEILGMQIYNNVD